MLTFIIGVLVGALIEESYPFMGKLFTWVKKQINK